MLQRSLHWVITQPYTLPSTLLWCFLSPKNKVRNASFVGLFRSAMCGTGDRERRRSAGAMIIREAGTLGTIKEVFQSRQDHEHTI